MLTLGDQALTVVDQDHFRSFFDAQQKKMDQVQKAKQKGGGRKKGRAKKKERSASDAALDAFLQVEFDQFQQECSVMNGSFAHYNALGSNHSLFHHDSALKQTLWDLRLAYLAQLAADKQCYLPLHTIEVEAPVFETPPPTDLHHSVGCAKPSQEIGKARERYEELGVDTIHQ